MIQFYDTNSLLIKMDDLFTQHFAISSISLTELEEIKIATNKDIDIKSSAQRLLRLLANNSDKYDVHIFKETMMAPISSKHLPYNNDMRILATAIDYDNTVHPDDTIFVTNDLALRNIANLFFGEDSIASVNEEDDYAGYKEVNLNEEQMIDFYSTPKTENIYNLLENEYLIIKDDKGDIVDKFYWGQDELHPIKYSTIKSNWFGDIKPYKNDIYQALAFDSLIRNKITMLRGTAGTGKTFLSICYLFSLLEKNKINKIIIFCNTVATKDSAKLGFYPGSKDEKLLDSQIGNLLISKLGSRVAVEKLMNEEKLILLPLSDIRGYDTSGMNAGIYISEAQNLSIQLIKLALQRIGEDSICIIDGDDKTQVDDIAFSGSNNGMKRVSKIFRGEDIYGEVELKIIHRSKIARIAEKL